MARAKRYNFLCRIVTIERQWKEQTGLKLQVEALQAERDMAEQDLVALYDLYVQATRARTCHLLQVSGDRVQALSWWKG